jgi:hypothetical protein
MVEQFGMPHFFHTFTADETNFLRWEKVTHMEDIAKTIDPLMSWEDRHVECVTLFYACVENFMHDVLLYGPKFLGMIDQYVIRYELQSRGFVHAHIILWMNQVNIERVSNEITVAMPTIFATSIGDFLEPVDSHQNKLFKIVMRKQLHTCNCRCQQ